MSEELPTLVFIWARDTKRWALYIQEDRDMNKIYLEKGLPKRIVLKAA